ncbi:MAG: methyltransferase domain-containing protein [Phycisphaerae bacterium]|jgi:SAM-dependent methyltransferase|nr:methyltransferase domain-containing protein [Phycisphaerae bacterium]MDP7289758.1 methyltransferase domain-containing protein [Phycisphaerae bacterium]
MRQPQIVNPEKVSNRLNKLAGAAILIANKVRHACLGYRTPRPFDASQVDRAVDYDFTVVDGWTGCLEQYCRGAVDLSGRRVLELGPGADLGVGLILLAMGAESYTAFDVHNLADSAGGAFYEQLFEKLADRADIDSLRRELALAREGAGQNLAYRCDPSFDLSAIEAGGIDLIVSQAVFEHFDDVQRTIDQMSKLAAPGAMLVCEIDLSTHTRWIRDRDPLNIYRFPNTFYNMMKFRGSPNRVRPAEYRQMLTDAGWRDIQQFPLAVLDEEYLASVQPSLSGQFRDDASEMECLSVVLCAKK